MAHCARRKLPSTPAPFLIVDRQHRAEARGHLLGRTLPRTVLTTLALFSISFQVQVQAIDSPLSRYLGAASCASSSCHGGAGAGRDASVIWTASDAHRRAAATLTTARSAQIARAAGLTDPVSQARCTVCHAPFTALPEALRLGVLEASNGVSCESCHGPAERWLRSHTRTDFSSADRAADGLRPLTDLYVRANTCVACHEHVEHDLLVAGHPELQFELDGQALAEPKHWREAAHYNGAQAWLVGQIVAARELTWHVSRSQSAPPSLATQAAAAHWLVRRAAGAASLQEATHSLDGLARAAARLPWSDERTAVVLRTLAGSGREFRDKTVSREEHARRAERLVLGLDRLLAASSSALEAKVGPTVNELFQLTQARPDFEPTRFATALDQLAAALPER